MDVAVLGETIDEILTRIPSLETTTASGTRLLETDEAEKLKQCLEGIKGVVDREKQNLLHGDQEVHVNWLRNLKNVVNDLSDLMEEISTINASLKPNSFKNHVKFIRSKAKKVIEDLQNVASKYPQEEEEAKKEAKLAKSYSFKNGLKFFRSITKKLNKSKSKKAIKYFKKEKETKKETKVAKLEPEIEGPSSERAVSKPPQEEKEAKKEEIKLAESATEIVGPSSVSEAPADLTLKKESLQELKLRFYDKLPRIQKLCFAFCSLFPCEHLIDVERLIHLWTAEGFLMDIPSNSTREETFRKYFNDFVGRPIFKDMEEDEHGVVRRCRMQPLMHDLARLVSDDEENITVDPEGDRVHEGVLRASFEYSLDDSRGIPDSLFKKAKKLRAILLWETHTLPIPKEMKTSTSICDKICKTFKTTLRMLDLHNMGIKSLPSSIGELINLRYLDLSFNTIEKLPGSITKLSNLQTLKLSQCYLLKELPKNIEDLINLRHIEIDGCLALTHMPSKIHELNSLQTLSHFVVSEGHGLGELASLNNLRGHLEILHLERLNLKPSVANDNYLKGKKHLQRLTLRWSHEDDKEDDRDKNTMDCLEPPFKSELKVLSLVGYKGSTLSSWLSSIESLVKLSLYDCTSCKFLPQLDQLPKLRFLELLRLDNLEFIAEEPDAAVFFPSLKELTISRCPKLKSWWKTNKKENIPFFPCISKLHVSYCPVLTCMPLYPCLDQELVLVDSSVQPLEDTIVRASTEYKPFSKLKSMQIKSIREESLPENWLENFSSLEKLDIREIPKLKSLPLGVDKVTSMQDLELHNCPEMTSLPESIGNLKSLGRLVISECNKLKSLPKELKKLESLRTLIILNCALLSPRCQPDTGDDWPQISHITNRQVTET